ncbi:MAG: UxaA family hydrolase [Thaumarchaeota archaeon]|nr:UxaA family hydrolase [Nitrososphaerota archaeon]
MKPERPSAVIISEKDNVATALRTLQAGEKVRLARGELELEVKLTEGVIPGHKFAISKIARGEHIIKFGEVIGAATADIRVGAHVHTHNVASLHGRVDQKPTQASQSA